MKLGLRKILLRLSRSFNSIDYWENRYRHGGNSGSGSYDALAQFKALFLNAFLKENGIQTAIEFGCGDGNQLGLINYPIYTGLDVSVTILNKCREKFELDKTKNFFLYHPDGFQDFTGIFQSDLSLSLDVIYHLVEDKNFETHLHHVFASSKRFVIIYSTDFDSPQVNHERNRNFSKWISDHKPDFRLLKVEPNPFKEEQELDRRSLCDFFVYERINPQPA